MSEQQVVEAPPRAARRPWWAKIPGMWVFVPPVVTPGREDDGTEGGAGEVLPFGQPGAVLRQSERAARSGWYAPAIQGAPSTTRQAEILSLAIIAPPTGTAGIVNGRDRLSRSLIAHDAPTAYNTTPREVTSPNCLTLGTVGVGKSSFTKTVDVARALILRNRSAAVFDKKPSDDNPEEGEYAPLSRAFGVDPTRFTEDGTGTRWNMLDPAVIEGSGANGQYDLLTAVARVARNDADVDEWERKALRSGLRRLLTAMQDQRNPTTADLLPYLGRVADDPQFRDLSPAALDRLHQAGLGLRWTFGELLELYPGLFDGDTSADVDLTSRLTVFDLSQLPNEGPAVPVVMAIGNMWLLGKRRRQRGADRTVMNVIYEEGWHMIGGPSVRLVESNEKLSRALGISNYFNMHKGTGIPKNTPGYTVIQEAQTIRIFRQDRRDDAEWAAAAFNLADETVDTLMNLPVGHCILKIAGRPEIQLQHVRSRWEVGFTNTDSALAVVSAA